MVWQQIANLRLERVSWVRIPPSPPMSNPYIKVRKIIDFWWVSFYVYHMLPGGIEAKHYHDGVEIEFVIGGGSSTHKKGHLYIRKNGDIHDGVNDSKEDLVFVCITIPSETKENTHYI